MFSVHCHFKILWNEYGFGRCQGAIIIFFQYRHIGDTADRYTADRYTDTSIGIVANPQGASDMPHDTDCPYPIQICAFFEMIRPYKILIRIGGNDIFWRYIGMCSERRTDSFVADAM